MEEKLKIRRLGLRHLQKQKCQAAMMEWQCKFRVAISRDYHDSSHEIIGNMVD